MKGKHPCACGLCKPKPGRRYHPEYGYDLALVAGINCQRCGRPIGKRPYVHDLSLARLGQMFLIHARCGRGY